MRQKKKGDRRNVTIEHYRLLPFPRYGM